MSTNYIAPIWRMPRNANNTPVDKLSNYSMDFDAGTSSQAINCGNSSDVDITGPISISVWFNTNNFSSSRGIVCKNDNNISKIYAQYLLEILNATLRWRAGKSDISYPIQTNQWYHAVGTYDGSNITLYINGAQVATASALSASYSSAEPMYIGYRLAQSYFGGQIAQVCIFDYALTDGTGGTTDQIGYLYNLNNPMAITGGKPVGYWPLGDNSNPNKDTLSNETTYPNISVGADSVFDFTPNQYIDIGDSNLFSFGDSVNDFPFSISGWFYFDATGSYGLVAKYGTTSTSREWMLYTTGSNFRLLLYDTNGQNAYADASDTTIVANNWYHVVATYNGAGGVPDAREGIQIYVNGQPETMTRAGGTGYVAMHNTERELELGTRSNTSYFDGQMSNVQIWNVELSAPNALELYNDGQPLMTGTQPQQSNLLAWWKLNQSAIWDNTDWSIDNAKSPANWQGCYDRNNSPVAMLRDNNSGPSYHNQVFSMSVWVKPVSGLATGGVIFSNQNSSNQGVSLAYNNNALVFKLGDKDTTAVGGASGNWANNNNRVPGASPTYTPYDSWSHIVVVWNGTNSKFYINGDLVSTITPPSALTIDYSFPSDQISAIGGRNDSTASGGIFTGKISNFAYWSSEIDQTAVTALYNNGTPEVSISQSPDHWFTLEDFDNGRVDQVGSLNYNDTATTAVPKFTRNFVSRTSGTSEGMNTTNLVQSNLTRTQPYSNYSLNFDANSVDYIEVANPGNIIGYGESAFTFSGWINADSISSNDGIFARYQDQYNRITIKLGLTSPFNGITLQIQNTSSVNGYSEWQNIITTGQWYHICAVYDGPQGAQADRLKLYLNGIDQGTRTTGFGTIPATTTNMTASTPLDIANDKRGTGRLFDGKVSNFCVFDRVLTDAEILKIYNNGITQDLQATSSFSNNILAWWPMDASNSYYNGTNWTVRDLQGGKDGDGINTGNVVGDMVGTAPGSEANGFGINLAIEDLKGNMYNSDKNAYSINMGDYADGVTNPADSGRSTEVPSV